MEAASASRLQTMPTLNNVCVMSWTQCKALTETENGSYFLSICLRSRPVDHDADLDDLDDLGDLDDPDDQDDLMTVSFADN